jgi:hypothetical protein
MKTDKPRVVLSGYKLHHDIKNVIHLLIFVTTVILSVDYFYKLPTIILFTLGMLGPFGATLLLCEIAAIFEKTDDK